MLQCGGAAVQLGGFFRRDPVAEVEGAPAMSMLQTRDGAFGQRIAAVARSLLDPRQARSVAAAADVVVARNLEMLAIAARVRRGSQPLVYECLDIHRLMLRKGSLGGGFRRAERLLLRKVDLLLTSSPAYLQAHFRDVQRWRGPSAIVENKVLEIDGLLPAPAVPPAGPPWRIGWFGMIRDRKSFALLKQLVSRLEGRVELVLAGRPVERELPSFEQELADTTGFRFVGAYAPEDLHELYGQVHFAWCIDLFEEDANANWSMANRQYESVAHGAVPIGEARVETGRWLKELRIGVRLTDIGSELERFFRLLTVAQYEQLRAAVLDVPKSRVATDNAECRALVATLADLAR